ncbi:exodeoxyribonuclease VII small subunit [Lactobacillus sp. UCMA15818]|uniref:exodeoxyribonuclease VII small subunit n=1 Tax=Lactobacillaceae TaxID=33958 RepID=UPI0025AEF9E2|nr:exodeoxyribonuclease VII small subunit [Lactobacillus sp. UCMA15818]MDN2452367.1 exodeoxyribonuclease VII small subunit [Lactobacillus sp. UCMA15818]
MAEKKNFEDNLKDLEEIVQKLEQGDVPLEQALEQFQRGVSLSNELQKTLENAEKTLAKVMDKDGNEADFERDTANE